MIFVITDKSGQRASESKLAVVDEMCVDGLGGQMKCPERCPGFGPAARAETGLQLGVLLAVGESQSEVKVRCVDFQGPLEAVNEVRVQMHDF